MPIRISKTFMFIVVAWLALYRVSFSLREMPKTVIIFITCLFSINEIINFIYKKEMRGLYSVRISYDESLKCKRLINTICYSIIFSSCILFFRLANSVFIYGPGNEIKESKGPGSDF